MPECGIKNIKYEWEAEKASLLTITKNAQITNKNIIKMKKKLKKLLFQLHTVLLDY